MKTITREELKKKMDWGKLRPAGGARGGFLPAGAPAGCDPVPRYEPGHRVLAGQERGDRRLLLELQLTLLDAGRP